MVKKCQGHLYRYIVVFKRCGGGRRRDSIHIASDDEKRVGAVKFAKKKKISLNFKVKDHALMH